MTSDHKTWRLRVLGYEELDGPERAEADAHLAACPDCRDLLDRLREIERHALPDAALPPLEAIESGPFDEATRSAADASLRELRSRVGLPSGRLRPTPRGRARIALPLALAAVVGLLLLAPRLISSSIQVREFDIAPASLERGGSMDTTPRRAWRAGQAFRLAFRLSRDGYPLVGHLDPRGRFEVLYPDAGGTTLRRFAGGQLIELPPKESPLDWIFTADPGRETFLVAASRRPGSDTARRLEAAVEQHGDGASRAARVGLARRLMETQVGPVQLIEVELIP